MGVSFSWRFMTKNQCPHIHFRRCHICCAINSKEEDLVSRCEACGKFLAPFYYFDERRALGLMSKLDVKAITTSLPREEYPPVHGISVYWD